LTILAPFLVRHELKKFKNSGLDKVSVIKQSAEGHTGYDIASKVVSVDRSYNAGCYLSRCDAVSSYSVE
jgi:hypothetical protein